jgi:hypothetical protein
MNEIIYALFHEVQEQEGKISDEDLHKHMRIFVECVHDITLNIAKLPEKVGHSDDARVKEIDDALSPLCNDLSDLVEIGHNLLDKWKEV